MSREPVILVNSIVAVIVAVISALVTGGVLQVSEGEQQQLVGIVVAIGTLVATLLSRSLVTPTASPQDSQGRSLHV